jgi:hypothetical protein
MLMMFLLYSVIQCYQRLEAQPPNARINPTADIITQPKSQHPTLMKAMLRRVGLNELLDFVHL